MSRSMCLNTWRRAAVRGKIAFARLKARCSGGNPAAPLTLRDAVETTVDRPRLV